LTRPVRAISSGDLANLLRSSESVREMWQVEMSRYLGVLGLLESERAMVLGRLSVLDVDGVTLLLPVGLNLVEPDEGLVHACPELLHGLGVAVYAVVGADAGCRQVEGEDAIGFLVAIEGGAQVAPLAPEPGLVADPGAGSPGERQEGFPGYSGDPESRALPGVGGPRRIGSQGFLAVEALAGDDDLDSSVSEAVDDGFNLGLTWPDGPVGPGGPVGALEPWEPFDPDEGQLGAIQAEDSGYQVLLDDQVWVEGDDGPVGVVVDGQELGGSGRCS
jgi:hypothetical protein